MQERERERDCARPGIGMESEIECVFVWYKTYKENIRVGAKIILHPIITLSNKFEPLYKF